MTSRQIRLLRALVSDAQDAILYKRGNGVSPRLASRLPRDRGVILEDLAAAADELAAMEWT